jgi:hypothetical protein
LLRGAGDDLDEDRRVHDDVGRSFLQRDAPAENADVRVDVVFSAADANAQIVVLPYV